MLTHGSLSLILGWANVLVMCAAFNKDYLLLTKSSPPPPPLSTLYKYWPLSICFSVCLSLSLSQNQFSLVLKDRHTERENRFWERDRQTIVVSSCCHKDKCHLDREKKKKSLFIPWQWGLIWFHIPEHLSSASSQDEPCMLHSGNYIMLSYSLLPRRPMTL